MKVKLTTDQERLIKSGTHVKTNEGNDYYFLPHWFRATSTPGVLRKPDGTLTAAMAIKMLRWRFMCPWRFIVMRYWIDAGMMDRYAFREALWCSYDTFLKSYKVKVEFNP